MKKTIVVLPFCVFLAFCSSSKKATTPTGISNVNVGRGDSMTSATKAASGFTSADRDWSYTANKDTSLNGTWTLSGMQGTDGSWKDMQTADTAIAMATDQSVSMTTDTAVVSEPATGTSAKATKKGKYKTKVNRKALYDSANVRLHYAFKDSSVLDTAATPYKYWTRIPTLSVNAAQGIFTGNTGCNSMSGSFNFGKNDIQFSRNIVTSKMACNEYDENAFLNALRKADSYAINGNTLELRQGSTLLLSFRKS